MNILALDCATKTGWATLINGQIESGVQDFSKKRGESNGMLFLRFNAWLESMAFLIIGGYETLGLDKAVNCNCKIYDVIAYEQAHHRGGYATELCVGLTTRAQEFAARIGAETMAAQSSEIKKFINQHVSKSEVIEQSDKLKNELSLSGFKAIKTKIPAMVWFKEQTERDPIDDNEADSYALLRFSMQELGITLDEFEVE